MVTDERTNKGLELANKHWQYIEDLLIMHNIDRETIKLVHFHYISTFQHGYKHGIADGLQLKYILKCFKRLKL